MAELKNDEMPEDGFLLSDKMMPLMQSMMQNILSKDFLYTSLKELSAKVCSLFFVLIVFIRMIRKPMIR